MKLEDLKLRRKVYGILAIFSLILTALFFFLTADTHKKIIQLDNDRLDKLSLE